MIQFGDLNIQKTDPTKKKEDKIQTYRDNIIITKEGQVINTNSEEDQLEFKVTTSKLDFKKDILGKTPKRSKEELRLIEPGYKIGTGEFPTLAIYCDQCEKVTAHACKSAKNRKICLMCKTITKLARNG